MALTEKQLVKLKESVTQAVGHLKTHVGYVDFMKNNIDSYRATALTPYHCVIYLKDGGMFYVTETFDYVDSLFGKEATE